MTLGSIVMYFYSYVRYDYMDLYWETSPQKARAKRFGLKLTSTLAGLPSWERTAQGYIDSPFEDSESLRVFAMGPCYGPLLDSGGDLSQGSWYGL